MNKHVGESKDFVICSHISFPYEKKKMSPNFSFSLLSCGCQLKRGPLVPPNPPMIATELPPIRWRNLPVPSQRSHPGIFVYPSRSPRGENDADLNEIRGIYSVSVRDSKARQRSVFSRKRLPNFTLWFKNMSERHLVLSSVRLWVKVLSCGERCTSGQMSRGRVSL